MLINKIVRNVFFCSLVFSVFFTSCSHLEKIDDVKRADYISSETFVLRTNYFQWFLRDYTVWQGSVYFTADFLEKQHNKLFTAKGFPFDNDKIKSFLITDIAGEKKYNLVMKEGNAALNEKFYYSLHDADGVKIAEFRKIIDNDFSGFNIMYEDELLVMRGLFNSKGRGAVSEVVHEGKVYSTFVNRINYFTEFTEVEIERINNKYPDILFIASAIVFDDRVKDNIGRFR